MTHIDHTFVRPDANGTLTDVDNPAKLQSLGPHGHTNHVKVLISIGGWNDGNDSGSESMAADAATRTAFVNNTGQPRVGRISGITGTRGRRHRRGRRATAPDAGPPVGLDRGDPPADDPGGRPPCRPVCARHGRTAGVVLGFTADACRHGSATRRPGWSSPADGQFLRGQWRSR